MSVVLSSSATTAEGLARTTAARCERQPSSSSTCGVAASDSAEAGAGAERGETLAFEQLQQPDGRTPSLPLSQSGKHLVATDDVPPMREQEGSPGIGFRYRQRGGRLGLAAG